MGASQSGIKSGTFKDGVLILTTEDNNETKVTGFVTKDSLKDFVTPKTIKKDGVNVEDPYVVTSALDAKFATFVATPGPIGPAGKDGAAGKDGESITGPPGKDGESITGPPGKDAVITKEIEGTLATSLASNATFSSSVASNPTLGANVASNTTLRTAVGTSLGNNLVFRSAVAGNADLRTAVAGNLAKDDTFRTAVGPIVAGNEDLRKSVANNTLLRANVASDGGFRTGVSTILKADTGFISSLKGAKGDTGTVSDTKTAKIDTLNVPVALNVAGVASFSGDVNFAKKATFISEIDVKNNANHRGTWTNFHGRTYFKKDVDLENSVKLALQNKDGKWSELNKQDGEWKHIFRGGKILVESDLKVDGSVNVDKICNKDGKNCVNVIDLLANKSTVTFRNIQRGNDGYLKAFQNNGTGVTGDPNEANWANWELAKK